MRLSVLDHDHSLAFKAQFLLVRLVSRRPLPDIMKAMRHRPEFWGRPLSDLFHDVMRGPSEWAVGERELIAAYVSDANRCAFCIAAHSATSRRALDEPTVAAALADPDTAPISPQLRATLRFVGTLTREHRVTADDVDAVFAARVSRAQLDDALTICFGFNVINRLADSFAFEVMPPEAYRAAAKFLLRHGYKM